MKKKKKNLKFQMYKKSKYICEKANLKEKLEKYGVAIIENVINDEECENMKSGFWDYLEFLTKNTVGEMDRNNRKTWRNLKYLFPKHGMLIQHFGIGHAEFSWKLRQNPNIYNIFSEFWEVEPEELLVSFDGASIHLPSEETGLGWQKKTWFHADQSFKRNEFECIQSFISANDINEGDATLRIIEKSHLYHKEFGETYETGKGDWFQLEDKHLNFYLEKGLKDVCIKCKAGSMVFWDSRTIHFGQGPLKTRKTENTRYVAYLCYTPRSFSGNEKQIKTNLKKKQKAFEEQRTTSHWPHKQKLFGKTPRVYPGQELLKFNEPEKFEISEIGMKFSGF